MALQQKKAPTVVKLKIRRGDLVKVISGGSKGQTGQIIRVLPEEQRVVVQGVNLVWKHKKPTATNTQGTREQMEAPIHISNVMLLDSNQTPTRVGRRLEEGKLVRFAKSTGLTVQTREVEIQETDNN